MFTIVINILISAATPEEAKHDAEFDLTSTDDETRELLDLYSILVNVANALAAVCFVLMFAHSFPAVKLCIKNMRQKLTIVSREEAACQGNY